MPVKGGVRSGGLARVVAVLVLAGLVVGACSDDQGSESVDGATGEATTTARPAYEPAFEPGPCDPERVPPAPAVVECGNLVVPEDRSDPDRAEVRLPVAIVRSSAADRKPDPIVYFSGGPGYPGVEASRGFTALPLAPDRDLIVFDQRGTGAATPDLECPEYDDASLTFFETNDRAGVEVERQLDALEGCGRRLTEAGVDLDHYDTPTIAADVADLRDALEIEEWNLFGASYGTAVALEVLRSHPEGVRSAVIDSVVPPDRPFNFSDDFREARRVFDELFEGCAASSECAAAYPDLEADFDEVVAVLDADPYPKTITSMSRPVTARFTGADLVAGAWNAMYDTELIPLIPFFVAQLAEGNRSVIDPVAERGLEFITGAAEGQTVAVVCADGQEGVDIDELRESMSSEPKYSTLVTVQPVPLACDAFDVESNDDGWGEIPEATVPVLVFGNQYDPVTPPEDSERTAEALGDLATYVYFAGLGHGATGSHPCPLSIFQAFVATPADSVDSSCAATMPEPAWVVG